MIPERNESLRPGLEALRQETSRLFNEANALKVQWSHLEQAQADEAQVRELVRSIARFCSLNLVPVDRNSLAMLSLLDSVQRKYFRNIRVKRW